MPINLLEKTLHTSHRPYIDHAIHGSCDHLAGGVPADMCQEVAVHVLAMLCLPAPHCEHTCLLQELVTATWKRPDTHSPILTTGKLYIFDTPVSHNYRPYSLFI